MNIRRVVWLLILLVYEGMLQSQTVIEASGPTRISSCEQLEYDFRIRTPAEEQIISFRFSEPITYIGNTLSDDVTIYSDGIDIIVNGFGGCDVVTGTLSIMPQTIDYLEPFQLTYRLGESVEEPNILESFVRRSFVEIEFGTYSFEASANMVSKTISITNVSNQDLSILSIDVAPDGQFATVVATDIGEVSDQSILIISSEALVAAGKKNGLLMKGESIELSLSFRLNSCEIRSVSYEPLSDCVLTSDNPYTHVDENVSERPSLAIDWPDSSLQNLNLGYCDYEYVDVLIWLESDSIGAPELSEAYNLSLSIDKLPFQSNNVFQCMDVVLRVGEQIIQASIAEGDHFSFDLDGSLAIEESTSVLKDLDDDGFYDDLSFGDTLLASIGVRVSSLCMDRPYGVNAMNGYISASYVDRCEKGFESEQLSFGIEGTLYFLTTVPEFRRDSRDEKFFEGGSSVTQRIIFNYNNGYIASCGSNTEVDFIIEKPSFLVLAEQGHFAIRNRTDTIEINPMDMIDSIIFDLPLSPSWTIITTYNSICNDLNQGDVGISCGDCAFSDLQFMQARYRMNCSQQSPCFLPDQSGRQSNGPFKLNCMDSGGSGQIIQVDSVLVDRLNTQWANRDRTMRIDPDNYPLSQDPSLIDDTPGFNDSLPGNVFFFESDTLRSRYFMNIGCVDMLEGFNISMRFQQNNTQTNLHVIDSRLINTLTNEEIDVRSLTTQTSQDLILSIDDPGALSSGAWLWYLTGTIDMSSDFVFSTSYVNQPLRYSLFESSVNGCEQLVDRQEYPLRLSEYFVERLFDATRANNFGILKYGIGRRSNYGPVLHPNQFTYFQSNALSEFREYPNVQTITYSVPNGYVIKDDLFRMRAYRLASSPFNFADVNEEPVLQDFLNQSYSPVSITTEANYTHYHYEVGDDYNLLPIGSFSFGSAEIMSIGVPESSKTQLYISGSILYKDHSGGTLQDISYEFQDSTELVFDDYDLQFDDNFRIIGSDTVQNWNLSNHVDGSTSLNFTFRELGNSLATLNDDYAIALHVAGIVVDSISIREEITDSPFDLGSYTISKQSDDSWIIRDTDYFFLSNPDIEFYTSRYDCGYDTLLVQYYPSNVDTVDCIGCVWRDTLVSYQPTGYPELNLNLSPNQLTNCESDFFEYRLENIGEGLLTNIQLSISSNIYEQLEVEYRDTSGSYQAALISTDTAANLMYWNLGQNDLNKLVGLNESGGLSGVDVRLRYTGACITAESAYLTVWSTSETRCGDILQTDISSLTDLPVVIEDDLDYNMNINVIQESECSGQLDIEIVIEGPANGPLENPSLKVLLPEELTYLYGTSTLNGLNMVDPDILLERDQIVLTWSDGLDMILGDSIILAFDIDISCSNICTDALISASLVSEVESTCSTNCNSRSVRSFLRDVPLPMSPLFIYREIHTDILGRDELGNLMLSLDVDIKQNNDLIYNPPIAFDVFFDSNGNDSLDQNDEIIFTSDYGLADYDFSDISIDELLSAPEEYLCQLIMKVSIGDCACYDLIYHIEPEPTVSLNDIIYTCGNDEILLYGSAWGACNRTWEDHSQIDLSDPVRPRYIVGPDLVADTIYAQLDCFGCTILDTIIIVGDIVDSRIDVIYPDNCDNSVSAELIISTEVPIANIIWEGYSDTTTTISGISGDSIAAFFTTVYGCRDEVSVALDQSFFQSSDWFIVSNDTSPKPGEQINLNIDGLSANGTISWRVVEGQILCDNCQEINIVVTRDQYVYATITDELGCSTTDSIWIDVISDSRVYVPNGFTPNGDGINDLYYPSFSDGVVDVREWSIYDRWGNRVHFADGGAVTALLAWDGIINTSEAAEGTYMYSLEIETADGNIQSYRGSLTLIR